MAVDPVRVYAFETLTGRPLGRVPFTGFSRSGTINAAGQMQVEVAWSQTAVRMDLWHLVSNWSVCLAAVRGDVVVHAGPVVQKKWDPVGLKATFTCGGGWTLLSKRNAVDVLLATEWTDGDVLIDEDHPAAQWALTCTGSLRNIARQLVASAKAWQDLPIDLPTAESGGNTRQWLITDAKVTSEALTDLTRVEGGPEIRFDPYRDEQGYFRWRMVCGTPEIINQTHRWNTSVPGERVQFVDLDDDGSDMVTQLVEIGGKQDDKVLVARATVDVPGVPLLQEIDTSHSTVSELSTLQAWAREGVGRGAVSQETPQFKVGFEWGVQVGDWADVRIQDVALGDLVLPVKVVGVSSDLTEWETISTRMRY
jgi:hypothetical protein